MNFNYQNLSGKVEKYISKSESFLGRLWVDPWIRNRIRSCQNVEQNS